MKLTFTSRSRLHSNFPRCLRLREKVYVTYQTLARVFHHISWHRDQKCETSTQPSFLTRCFEVFGNVMKRQVWLLMRLLQQIHTLGENEGENLANLCKWWITFQSTFAVISPWNLVCENFVSDSNTEGSRLYLYIQRVWKSDCPDITDMQSLNSQPLLGPWSMGSWERTEERLWNKLNYFPTAELQRSAMEEIGL